MFWKTLFRGLCEAAPRILVILAVAAMKALIITAFV
jgi:hypothetical protein